MRRMRKGREKKRKEIVRGRRRSGRMRKEGEGRMRKKGTGVQ
jgi:hypothetical protein